MRSKLFVPGARPELFDKALVGDADALSFDLEDSVTADRKSEARRLVAAYVSGDPLRNSTKTVIVRVNAPDTADFEEDIAALARIGVTLLNLPKIESAAALRAVIGSLQRAEAANGVARPIGLLVNIETPRALANAAEIASAHPRVVGLQLGLADLFSPHGIDRHDARNVHAVMFAVRMAAAQAGVFAMDGAFADVGDADGFTAEAQMARRLGFVGKSCIHPAQVALANAAFAAGDEELAAARRIIDAASAAEHRGLGAFLVDGRMVDAPFVKRAQALLAAHDAGQGA